MSLADLQMRDMRQQLRKHPSRRYRSRPRSAIKKITVHHSATMSGSAEAYANYHVQHNNWPGIGYHFVIEKDGTIKWCHDVETLSWHVGNGNGYSVGVCLTGNFIKQEPTAAQSRSLNKLLRALMEELKLPREDVWGHYQYPGYATYRCPEIDMDQLREQLRPQQQQTAFTKLPAWFAAPFQQLPPPPERQEFKPTILKRIEVAMKRLGYVLFTNDRRDLNLNLIGVRNADPTTDLFNDAMHVLWRYQGEWQHRQYRITTDPGRHYLLNPLARTSGTAILKPGQYRGAYMIGTHVNHRALVQQGNAVTVYRDSNRDHFLNTEGSPEQTGYFGINIHRAHPTRTATVVHNWSAGCQVFADPIEFTAFMQLVQEASGIWGNRFTYTLLTEQELG